MKIQSIPAEHRTAVVTRGTLAVVPRSEARDPTRSPATGGDPSPANRIRSSCSGHRGATLRLRLIPRDERFFDLFVEDAANVLSGARLLEAMLRTYDQPEARAAEIRATEHRGDEISHDIGHRLEATFVTPFDREDIHALISGLDDVLDDIEEAADMFVLYRIEAPTEIAVQQAAIIVKQAEQLHEALAHLQGFKNLEPYWIEVHRLENEGDGIARAAIAGLFARRSTRSPRQVEGHLRPARGDDRQGRGRREHHRADHDQARLTPEPAMVVERYPRSTDAIPPSSSCPRARVPAAGPARGRMRLGDADPGAGRRAVWCRRSRRVDRRRRCSAGRPRGVRGRAPRGHGTARGARPVARDCEHGHAGGPPGGRRPDAGVDPDGARLAGRAPADPCFEAANRRFSTGIDAMESSADWLSASVDASLEPSDDVSRASARTEVSKDLQVAVQALVDATAPRRPPGRAADEHGDAPAGGRGAGRQEEPS